MRTMLLLAIMVTGLLLIAGCSNLSQPCVEGSGNGITETRNVSDFRSVTLDIPATVTVYQGGGAWNPGHGR